MRGTVEIPRIEVPREDVAAGMASTGCGAVHLGWRGPAAAVDGCYTRVRLTFDERIDTETP